MTTLEVVYRRAVPNIHAGLIHPSFDDVKVAIEKLGDPREATETRRQAEETLKRALVSLQNYVADISRQYALGIKVNDLNLIVDVGATYEVGIAMNKADLVARYLRSLAEVAGAAENPERGSLVAELTRIIAERPPEYPERVRKARRALATARDACKAKDATFKWYGICSKRFFTDALQLRWQTRFPTRSLSGSQSGGCAASTATPATASTA